MTTPDLFGVSPFDAIRLTDEIGTEFWSARDLMPLLTYPTWQHFRPVIDRAIQAAENQGIDLEINFTVVREVSGQRGPAREDVHLSRFAAYLVAMNGDPRKPEVAAAQAYFAVKTREAEVAPARELTDDELMLKALTVATERVAALTARAETAEAELTVAAPKADAFDSFLSAAGDYSVRDAVKVLNRDHAVAIREKALYAWLQDHRWIYRDAARNWCGYADAIASGYVAHKAQWHHHPSTGEKVIDPPQLRITAKGIDRLRDRLTRAA